MEQSNAKNVFSRLGFAQAAGGVAAAIFGRLVLMPLVTGENLQKTFDTMGAFPMGPSMMGDPTQLFGGVMPGSGDKEKDDHSQKGQQNPNSSIWVPCPESV